MSLTLFNNPISRTSYKNLTNEQRYILALSLDQEYRGDGIGIDSSNLSEKIKNTVNKERLERMALYINVYRRIIDTEANSYSQRGFQRHFIGVNKTQYKHLVELYKELDADIAFLEFERQASYLGTVLTTITNDPDTNKLKFIKLTPATTGIGVIPKDYFPSEIKEIEHTVTPDLLEDKKIKSKWDSARFTMTVEEGGNSRIIESLLHGYHMVPFAILRYVTDSSKFWGPLDYSAYSFFQTRSLLLSDSVLRSQTAIFDILVLTEGWSIEDAVAATKTAKTGKVISTPEPKLGPDGTTISPDIKFITPSMLEPEKLWQLYQNIYTHFLQSRGMTPRNFESSKDAQSADAQRISDQYILSLQQSRKRYLQHFEQEVFELIKWRNNNYTNNEKIPETAVLITDFQDPLTFSSTTEKVAYFEYMIRQNILTPVDIMRIENPDLTVQQATNLYEDKKAFNEVNNSDTEQEKETEEEIDIGDEGNPYKRKFENGKYYWTWGSKLKWYVGSKDPPPAKLRNKVAAIQAKNK